MSKILKFTPVSRAHEKLEFALKEFGVDLKGKVCCDFGSSTGGFVQAILEQDPAKIYSIETSKNRLHFTLKNFDRVIILDNQNAVHVELPEKVDFISIDVGWTKQELIIPSAVNNLKDDGVIISLIKPHYEAGRNMVEASDSEMDDVLDKVREDISEIVKVVNVVESPITGKKGKNKEYLALLKKK